MRQLSDKGKRPSVCIVHDWLIAMRGGEKVLEAVCEIYPDADIYTLFLDGKKLSPVLQAKKIHASFLQYFPGITQYYRWLLPLMPVAIRSLNLNRYDLVISISHCVAKSVRVRKDAVHVCYCNAPMRYIWDFTRDYFRHFPPVLQALIEFYFKWLREWDRKTAQDVTHFIGNSHNISRKILKFYGRRSGSIYPALDLVGEASKLSGDYYLCVGALVPYKRIDIAIEAFNDLKKPLMIVGEGPTRRRLEQLVKYPGIHFDGWLNEYELKQRYSHAIALIFPGEEDFGIVPLEAQAFGKPVIAFGRGGVRETVIANTGLANSVASKSTGVFFNDQTPTSLKEAVKQLERLKFDSAFMKKHVEQFRRGRFISEFKSFLSSNHISFPETSPPISRAEELVKV